MITKYLKTKIDIDLFLKEHLLHIDSKYLNKNPYKTLRNKKDKINKLILHTTAGYDISGVKIGIGQKKNVSFHYIVLEEQNKVYKLIDDKYIGYHAGGNDLIDGTPNNWLYYGKQKNGFWNMNANSIGIEIVNKEGIRTVNDNQIKNTIALILDLLKIHNLKPKDILAHFEIASFKFDPYLNFTKGKRTSALKQQDKQVEEMNLFRDEIERLYNIINGINIEVKNIEKKIIRKYDGIKGIELFSDLDDNYETKKLIEIGLYRFYEDIRTKKIKFRR